MHVAAAGSTTKCTRPRHRDHQGCQRSGEGSAEMLWRWAELGTELDRNGLGGQQGCDAGAGRGSRGAT